MPGGENAAQHGGTMPGFPSLPPSCRALTQCPSQVLLRSDSPAPAEPVDPSRGLRAVTQEEVRRMEVQPQERAASTYCVRPGVWGQGDRKGGKDAWARPPREAGRGQRSARAASGRPSRCQGPEAGMGLCLPELLPELGLACGVARGT